MGRDGEDVLFAPLGGQAPDPEAFLARALDGWAPQQRSKDFSPATILTRRNVVMSFGGFPEAPTAPMTCDHRKSG